MCHRNGKLSYNKKALKHSVRPLALKLSGAERLHPYYYQTWSQSHNMQAKDLIPNSKSESWQVK